MALPTVFSEAKPVQVVASGGILVRQVDLNGVALDNANYTYSEAMPVMPVDSTGTNEDASKVFSVWQSITIDPNGIPVIRVDSQGNATATALSSTGAVFTPNLSGDGDSISAATTYGFMNRAFSDYTAQGITTVNLSQAGACFASTENATNNLMGRIPSVVSSGSTLHVVACGTNDLAVIDANTTISRLTAYVNGLRSAGYTGKIAVCGVGPCSAASTGGHANVNSRRGSFNSQVRGLVGTLIDAYIPRGEHPIYDVDSAASNTAWWNADGIHPLQLPHRAYWQMLHDVLDPYVANSTATAPTSVPLPNIFDAPASQLCTMRGRVTGMKLGQSASYSATGASTAVGLGAFDTTTKPVMNGDVILIQDTSSATANAELDHSVSIGGTSATWKLVTQPASWPARATALDPAHKASTVTLSGTPALTATAGSGGAFQLALPTDHPDPAAQGLIYFEVLLGTAGDTAAGKLISVHDASLIGNYTKIAGLSAGFQNAGVSISGPGSASNVIIYSNGVAIGSANASLDYIPFPALTAGTWLGVVVDPATGRVWFQYASGSYIHGDPTIRDGGCAPATPPATIYCSPAPKTLSQSETVNYGASAFVYSLPLGARPHG